MLNKNITIIIIIQFLFSYSVFEHAQDFKIPSSTYIASDNIENLYNFNNPACNQLDQNKYLYSSYGDYFDGIIKNQNIYFSTNSTLFKKLDFSIIRSSIDDIYNTINAWNDNGDGIIDISEIDYNNISTFSHNTLGLIISKPFLLKEKYNNIPFLNSMRYGINSKFSISSILTEKSFSHSFDLGFIYFNSKVKNHFWIPNIGLLIKDFLPYSYWSTGQIENKKTSIILGSSFSFETFFNNSNQHFFYFNSDFDLSDFMYPSIGFEYQFKNSNSLISFQINNSKIENSLGFIVRLTDQFDIAYSFIIPKNDELYTSQKIMIGINKDILNNIY